jgi:hypothetical protein
MDSVSSTGVIGLELHDVYPSQYDKAAYDAFVGLHNVSAGYAPPYNFWTRSGYTQAGAVSWAHWTGDAVRRTPRSRLLASHCCAVAHSRSRGAQSATWSPVSGCAPDGSELALVPRLDQSARPGCPRTSLRVSARA